MEYSSLIRSLLELTIAEDCPMGDLTADALIPKTATGKLALVAREPLVVCGQMILDPLARRFGLNEDKWQWLAEDGQQVEAGTVVACYEGPTRTLLAFERPALNFLQRLSGIATLTRQYVGQIEHTNTTLLDTRKTIPGHRVLEKYATRTGGAINHRHGLDRGWLIKENHIREVGSVAAAVQRAKAYGTHGLKIEIEVETFDELAQAVDAGADIILLDNFSVTDVERAVQVYGRQVALEASGGIHLENIAQYANTGVDFIAVGALTHSARSCDLAADLTPQQS